MGSLPFQSCYSPVQDNLEREPIEDYKDEQQYREHDRQLISFRKVFLVQMGWAQNQANGRPTMSVLVIVFSSGQEYLKLLTFWG